MFQCDGIHYFKKQLILLLCFFLLGCSQSVKNLDEANIDKNKKEKVKYLTLKDFHQEETPSTFDYNEDGIGDYDAFLEGARKDARNHPVYDPSYVQGGYPDPDRGVCTDVIWRAFREGGYNLKEMVDNDIKRDLSAYPRVDQPDPNIDFRRVPNLDSFFKKYGIHLTTDTMEIGQWQRGDIVIYGKKHIAMVSNRYNKKGEPWIIHNFGQKNREEDGIHWGTITAHYRFDASQVPEEILCPWEE